MKNPLSFLREDWAGIRVPAVPKRSIDRLRRLGEADWARLSVIEQYQTFGQKLFPGPPEPLMGPPGEGARWIGLGLQLALQRPL